MPNHRGPLQVDPNLDRPADSAQRPGKRYLNWELDDPAAKDIEHVRPIRDEIDRRVTTLLAELVPTTA